jgi:hypothetical protein
VDPCQGKIPYPSRKLARKAAGAQGGDMGFYKCGCGEHWHIGHRGRFERVAYGASGGVPRDDDWEALARLHAKARSEGNAADS